MKPKKKGTATPAAVSKSAARIPSKTLWGLAAAAFAFFLYAQTLSFKYALDDQPVIRDNVIVHKGFSGIKELLSTDFWHGSNVGVSIPLYRPASLVLFAIEWQLFPDSPGIYHAIHVLLYALTCWLLFGLLLRLFRGQFWFALACTVLYAAHPLHTEVVSNIKSADEILCCLFVILSARFSLDFAERSSKKGAVLSAVFFFLALMSKESGIVLLAVVPLLVYFFTAAPFRRNGMLVLILLVPAALYFFVRSRVLAGVPAYETSPLVNTLYAAPDWLSQKATALYVLLLYLRLLVFPHPLSYTYDFNQVKIQEAASAGVLLSLVLHLALLVLALYGIRKKTAWSFAILFYLVTLAPVSNIFLTIGSPMAERFLYIPSLGFCIALAWLFFRGNEKAKDIAIPRTALAFILPVLLLWSGKTVSRSLDWKDNVSLFGHDVKVATESAPAHLHWANALMSVIYEKKSGAEAVQVLDQAEAEYKEAIRIFPPYLDAWLHLGDVYAKKNDVPSAIAAFEKYNDYVHGNSAQVLQYLGGLYDKAGRYDEAMKNWKGVIAISGGTDAQAYYYVGLLNNKKKQYSNALPWLDSAIHIEPSHLLARKNLALAYLNLGEDNKVLAECDTLLSYDRNFAKAYCYKGFVSLNRKDYKAAMEFLEQASRLDPADAESSSRLAILKQMKQAGSF